jgi:hypothetical protein
MCGIFGFSISSKFLDEHELNRLLHDLFIFSESRGKEASGISILDKGDLKVLKSPHPASELIRGNEYRQLIGSLCELLKDDTSFIQAIGHSRLVTNGGQQNNLNNQPAITENIVAIHNGIITNVDSLWQKYPTLEKKSQLDTEVFLRIFYSHLQETKSIQAALKKTYSEIEGVASIAMQIAGYNLFLLSTNNGSAYYLETQEPGVFIFASERYILEQVQKKHSFLKKVGEIRQLLPGTAVLFHIEDQKIQLINFQDSKENDANLINPSNNPLMILDVSKIEPESNVVNSVPGDGPRILPKTFIDIFPELSKKVDHLRRCTRCILPETMPFIDFDEHGVCNYCRADEKQNLLGLDALLEAVEPYRKNNGEPECLVTFSGGRDSSYGVHFISEVLKMKPITYTYDWGMITDLGRRNQMRVCGKLGVENIVVSADITKKRKNIRLNVTAWLKKPDLGTIPLFMAGDKQYFYYANLVGRHTGCKIIVLCENLLETTRFKTGFCGISPHFGSEHTYTLSLGDKFRLLSYYGQQFTSNPSYLNESMIDTFGAYLSYYFLPHNYLNLYQYIEWNEATISETLKTYKWETAGDTTNTWRIGDGTASFYNYIYYAMAGLTENDTFRSNQIRAGYITREDALRMVREENVPRYGSIQWYCETVGIDFETAIKQINNAPRRY